MHGPTTAVSKELLIMTPVVRLHHEMAFPWIENSLRYYQDSARTHGDGTSLTLHEDQNFRSPVKSRRCRNYDSEVGRLIASSWYARRKATPPSALVIMLVFCRSVGR